MSEERLIAAINRLLGWHGALSVEGAAERLIAEGYFDEEFQAKAVQRAATNAVRRAFQATDATGKPLFRMRPAEDEGEAPLHVQLDLADEHDWKFTLDQKAQGIRSDYEKYQRELDVFEAIFGYRYASPNLPSIERMAGVEYGDGTDEPLYR